VLIGGLPSLDKQPDRVVIGAVQERPPGLLGRLRLEQECLSERVVAVDEALVPLVESLQVGQLGQAVGFAPDPPVADLAGQDQIPNAVDSIPGTFCHRAAAAPSTVMKRPTKDHSGCPVWLDPM
jgi:hypothetical protein